MSTATLEAYRPSGRFTVGGVLLPVVAAVALALPAGFAYAYLVNWVPIAYFGILFNLGYGFGFGWLGLRLMKAGKVRNRPLAFGAGLVVGLLAEYGNWNGHVHYLFKDLPLVVPPAVIWKAAGILYQHGSWTLGHGGSGAEPVTGVFLALVWAAEAAVIVGFPAMMAFNLVADTPFCEATLAWLDQTKQIDTLAAIDQPDQIALLRAGSLQPVIDAAPRPPGSDVFTRLILKRTSAGGTFCTVRVVRVTIKRGKKGNPQPTVRHLTRDLVLPDSLAGLITQLESYGAAPA